MGLARADVLRATSTVLRAFASALGFLVFGLFGFVLMQSSLRVALADALGSSDVLVTAVFGVGGWLFVKYLDSVNERFNSVDKRFDRVDAALQELKALVIARPGAQSPPTSR
jgi:hypothetical protein